MSIVYPLLRTLVYSIALPSTTDFSYPSYLSNLTDEQLAYWQQGVPQADCEAVLTLIEGAATLDAYDPAITDILWEEAESFFHGVHTAREAAAFIQNRVSTYLAERG